MARDERRWRRAVCAGLFSILPLGFALWAAGCRARSPLTAEQAEGKRLFDERCAHCHLENDLDLKPAPPEIRGVLTRAELPSGAPATDLEVMRVVLNGKNKMPSFAGRFTEPQMAALLAYLRMPK